MVLGAAGDPTHRLLAGLVAGLGEAGGPGFGSFRGLPRRAHRGNRRFCPLARAGRPISRDRGRFAVLAAGARRVLASAGDIALAARRLGETLTALVLSKLVIASVLALAAGLLGSSSSVAGVVEGVALLAVAAFAPFALLRLVPAVEAGAVAHLEGLSRQPVRAGQRLGTTIAGLEIGGIGGLGGLSSPASKGLGGPGAGRSSLRTVDHLGAGPFTADRPVARGGLPPDSGRVGPGPVDPTTPVGPVGTSADLAGPVGSSSVADRAHRQEATSDVTQGAEVARWTMLLSQGDRQHG